MHPALHLTKHTQTHTHTQKRTYTPIELERFSLILINFDYEKYNRRAPGSALVTVLTCAADEGSLKAPLSDSSTGSRTISCFSVK